MDNKQNKQTGDDELEGNLTCVAATNNDKYVRAIAPCIPFLIRAIKRLPNHGIRFRSIGIRRQITFKACGRQFMARFDHKCHAIVITTAAWRMRQRTHLVSVRTVKDAEKVYNTLARRIIAFVEVNAI